MENVELSIHEQQRLEVYQGLNPDKEGDVVLQGTKVLNDTVELLYCYLKDGKPCHYTATGEDVLDAEQDFAEFYCSVFTA